MLNVWIFHLLLSLIYWALQGVINPERTVLVLIWPFSSFLALSNVWHPVDFDTKFLSPVYWKRQVTLYIYAPESYSDLTPFSILWLPLLSLQIPTSIWWYWPCPMGRFVSVTRGWTHPTRWIVGPPSNAPRSLPDRWVAITITIGFCACNKRIKWRTGVLGVFL